MANMPAPDGRGMMQGWIQTSASRSNRCLAPYLEGMCQRNPAVSGFLLFCLLDAWRANSSKRLMRQRHPMSRPEWCACLHAPSWNWAGTNESSPGSLMTKRLENAAWSPCVWIY